MLKGRKYDNYFNLEAERETHKLWWWYKNVRKVQNFNPLLRFNLFPKKKCVAGENVGDKRFMKR